MNHKEVVRRFALRQKNARTGNVEWAGHNVYCRDNVLFSYGSHFPLAIYLGERDGQPFFIKNADKYSVSTSHHQSITSEYCKGPSLSTCHLEKNKIEFAKIKLEDVIHFQPRFSEFVYLDTKTGLFYEEAHCRRTDGWADQKVDASNPWFTGGLEEKLVDKQWTPPKNTTGGFTQHYKRDKVNRIRSGSYTIPEAVVLKSKRSYYLCSYNYDKGFACKLPGLPDNVEHAFEMKNERDKRT